MSVRLSVIDARDEIGGPSVSEVPDGFRIIVRRCADGADVFVLPGLEDASSARPDPIGERLIAVHGFTVERNRPGSAEVVIQDAHREEWRLYLGGSMGGDLASCLQGGAPNSARDSHEAALARRANAEAQLAELEVAQKTRALRPTARPIKPGSLRVEFNADDGLASICAADLGGGPEVRIELAPNRLVWLAEQLLHAKRHLDGGES